MDRGTWWATVQGVPESHTRLATERVRARACTHTHTQNAVLLSDLQQSDSVTYIYIHFFIFFSIMVYHRVLNMVPCAVQQDLVHLSYV